MDKSKKDWKPILIYVLVEFVLPMLIIIPMSIIFKKNHISMETEKVTYVLSIFVGLLFFLIIALIYKKRIITDISRLSKKVLIKIIIASIIAVILNDVICHIFEYLNVEMKNQDILLNLFNSFPISTTILTLLAPFTEEMIFRYSIRTIIKNDVLFVIISSLIFGLMHGVGIATILYVLIGVFLAVIYLKTDKNVMASAIAHFINNIFGIISML